MFAAVLLAAALVVGCGLEPAEESTGEVTAGAVSEFHPLDGDTSIGSIPSDVQAWLDRSATDGSTDRGACCLSDGCVSVTEEVCAQIGGSFLGVGRPCDAEACQVALLAAIDSDADGCSDLNELLAETDPHRPGDCRDIDGDGLPNVEDPDVDGDGRPNEIDDDIDGDGRANDEDDDPDGDGDAGEEDPDEDGDGLSDRFDLDDDGDGEADDEDADNADDDEGEDDDEEEEEDDDDEPEDRLQDLIERLRDGKVTAGDRAAIAREIAKRLQADDDKRQEVEELLRVALEQAQDPLRLAPENGVPRTISSMDAVYRQLKLAIEVARKGQSDPDAKLQPERMPAAMKDFLARVSSITTLGEAFHFMSHEDIGAQVRFFARSLNSEQTQEMAQVIADELPRFDGRGSPEGEANWLEQMRHGAVALKTAFPGVQSRKLVDTSHELFRKAERTGGQRSDRTAEYHGLLRKMSQAALEHDDIDAALEQVISDEEAEDGEEEEETEE